MDNQDKTTSLPIDTLIQEASSAQKQAYAPYSRFPVGAAVYTTNGKIFSGANIENVTYGLTVCAERNAIMQAVLSGEKNIIAVAIVSSSSPPATPCGMCLQVLAEFTKDCEIILTNIQGEQKRMTLSQLLPFRFAL